jgi:predicted HicB family RNase H-like nuclease
MSDRDDDFAGVWDGVGAASADDTDAQAEAEGETEVKFNARVPASLRDAFQEVCEAEGRSMSWVVREYMRRAVRQGETGL